MKRALQGAVLGALASVLACGGGGKTGQTAGDGVTKTIGVSGGTVSLPGGPSLVIPQGALAVDTAIAIQGTGAPVPSGAMTALYRFQPDGTTFATPVVVSFTVPAGTTTAAVYWTKAGSTTDFESLPTALSGTTATASVSHFSLGYVGPPPSAVEHSISGTVSGAVLQGVTIALSGASAASTTTDAAGYYSFGGLADGSYTVTPSLPGHTFAPPSRPVALGGADASGQDFAATTIPLAATFSVTGSLQLARHRHTATLLPGGKVLVAGGLAGSASLTTAELYDPATGAFTTTGSLATARNYATATLLPSGRVLVTGGAPGTSGELYDPATGSFAATGNMGMARFLHTATRLLNGKVLVTGGESGTSGASAELYDPATGTFAATGSPTATRQSASATLLPGGTVLVAGGWHGVDVLASAELYDPATGTFTATGSMVSSRTEHADVLLLSGKVLIAGGIGISQVDVLGSAELYDPTTGVFATTGSLTTARELTPMTLLPSGKVLVAGGTADTQGAATVLSGAELYDPTAGTFSATASLGAGRCWHTATLLPSGAVLVAGGWNGSAALGTAELYRQGFTPSLEALVWDTGSWDQGSWQ